MTTNGLVSYAADPKESERALVGVLLIWPGQLAEAAGTVTLDDFTDNLSKAVFNAMLMLWGRGITPTLPTMSDELRQTGVFDRLGVENSVLATLQAESPSSRQVGGLCRLIVEESTRRRLALVGKTVTSLAADRTVNIDEALDQAKQIVADVELPGQVESEVEPVGRFCEGSDSFDWLVPSVMERGDRTLIVAPESAGKSMLMRQIAVTCSFGIHPFNGRALDPLRVLMIDLENPPSMARRKIRPMLTKAREVRPYGDDTMMGIVCRPAGIDVAHRADARWLAGQIAAARPDLVLCGPLYKMFSPDEHYETGAKAVTTVLDDLRTRFGFALVLETHAPQEYGGKRDMRPIGSSLWRRWTDFGLSFEPILKDDKRTIVKVKVWKPRDERQWPRFMQRGGAWPWTPCGDPGSPGDNNHYHNQPGEEPF